jgi:sulfatase modifying factor 1
MAAPLVLLLLAASSCAVTVDGPPSASSDRDRAADRAQAPRSWTSETRRVLVAAPQGDQSREITYYRNSVGMGFVRVPAGQFMMGSRLSAAEVDARWPAGDLEWYEQEHPRHAVTVSHPFFIGACEVTRGEFAQFVREAGHRTEAERAGRAGSLADDHWAERPGVTWQSPGFEQDDRHPVVCVSWADAIAFCRWLSEREGVTYGLPTEAAWEYAARAGTETVWYWGDADLGAQGRANVAGGAEEPRGRPSFEGVRDGHSYTAPVARFQPNGWGLYDVAGNVWEWCADWYGDDYYAHSPAADPPGPASGEDRAVRGGSWDDLPGFCRSALRLRVSPAHAGACLGFRVVASP